MIPNYSTIPFLFQSKQLFQNTPKWNVNYSIWQPCLELLYLSAISTKPIHQGKRKSRSSVRSIRRMWEMLDKAKVVLVSSVAEPELHLLVRAGAITRCGSGSNSGIYHG
jgi:hypothetical protein